MSWVEVDGAGWRRVHGLVISVLKNKALLRKQVLRETRKLSNQILSHKKYSKLINSFIKTSYVFL